MPAMPHSAAGPRIEPPVSEPVPPSTRPAATAAPVPDDEPAVKWSVFHGLRAGGGGIGEGPLLGHEKKRVELRIEPPDARQVAFRELDRRDLATLDQAVGLGDGEDLGHQSGSALKVTAGSASRGNGAFTRSIIR